LKWIYLACNNLWRHNLWIASSFWPGMSGTFLETWSSHWSINMQANLRPNPWYNMPNQDWIALYMKNKHMKFSQGRPYFHFLRDSRLSKAIGIYSLLDYTVRKMKRKCYIEFRSGFVVMHVPYLKLLTWKFRLVINHLLLKHFSTF
jgi:hypothetical protein